MEKNEKFAIDITFEKALPLFAYRAKLWKDPSLKWTHIANVTRIFVAKHFASALGSEVLHWSELTYGRVEFVQDSSLKQNCPIVRENIYCNCTQKSLNNLSIVKIANCLDVLFYQEHSEWFCSWNNWKYIKRWLWLQRQQKTHSPREENSFFRRQIISKAFTSITTTNRATNLVFKETDAGNFVGDFFSMIRSFHRRSNSPKIQTWSHQNS